MARTRRAEGDRKIAQRIVREAERAFARRGYHEVSLAEIANSVGVRVPSLLYHFPTKRALYEAVVRGLYTRLEVAIARSMTQGGTPSEQLSAILEAVDVLWARHSGLARVVLSGLIAPDALGGSVLEEFGPRLLDGAEGMVRAALPETPASAPVRTVLLALFLSHLGRLLHGSLAKRLWSDAPADPVIRRALLELVRTWPEPGGRPRDAAGAQLVESSGAARARARVPGAGAGARSSPTQPSPTLRLGSPPPGRSGGAASRPR